MTKIALRAYNHEIESIIEQGQRLDEAVAHCLHILASYPKHLDTYRLLGKAYLEAKRHDQAVDIFQRVLVSVPDDFVSHVGMSIIADEQGKLDDAIWHMERAFEVQPSNGAIQAELQRLFGRRDGTEPPKIRLTRGALAHMYVQGDLYAQAISEIRAVLANDPDRMDMQVLLARAYFRNGQKAEAADVCAALLAVSAYCLDANRLMAEILPGTQAADAAQEYRRRVLELDPYAEFAKGSTFAVDAVADGSVTLQHLDDLGAAAAVGAGLALDVAPAAAPADPKAVPDWLTRGGDVPRGEEAQSEQDQDLPDFLRGSGWREVPAGSADAAPDVASAVEADNHAELEAMPGELPDWVKALAPNEDQEPASSLDGRAPSTDLQGVESSSLGPDAGPNVGGIDETPDWLRELAQGAEPSPTTAPRGNEAVPTPQAGDRMPARNGPGPSDDGLGWLEGLAEKHGAKPEELITPSESRSSSPPEWIGGPGYDETRAPDGWMPVDERSAGAEPPTDGPTAQELQPDRPSSDWLNGLADKNAFAEMERSADDDQAPFESESSLPAGLGTASGAALPEWLAEETKEPNTASATVARESSGEYESGAELPDWLADLDGAKKSTDNSERATSGNPEWFQPEAEPREASPGHLQWQPVEADSPAGEKPTAHPQDLEQARSPAALPRAPQATPPSRDALPAKPRSGQQTSTDASFLVSARAELSRGNIAAALDIYGRLLRKGRALDEIIRELRDALYRYPVEVSIWQALGDAYMRANRLQEALDAYTKAEELLR